MFEHLRFSYGDRPGPRRGYLSTWGAGELVFLLGPTVRESPPCSAACWDLLPGYQGCVRRADGRDVESIPGAPRLWPKIAYIPQTSHMRSFPARRWSWCSWAPTTGWAFSPRRAAGSGAIAMEALEELGIGGLRPPELRGAVRWRAAACTGGPGSGPAGLGAAADDEVRLPPPWTSPGNQVRVLEAGVSAPDPAGVHRPALPSQPQHAMLYAQRVVALHDGLVAADGPPDQALDEALMRKLYGVPARFVRTGDGVLIAPVRKSIGPVDPRHAVRFMADAIRGQRELPMRPWPQPAALRCHRFRGARVCATRGAGSGWG
ncbi:MAG: hypothetical protein ACLRWQ_06820 [Flavonifractor plautii]